MHFTYKKIYMYYIVKDSFSTSQRISISLELPNDGYHQSKEEEEVKEFHGHPYNQFHQLNDGEINHSSGFQEGWLNNLNYEKKLGPSRLDNLQCTINEVGIDQASPRLKQKKGKGEVIEVNRGRLVRPLGRKDKHSKVCTARGTRDRRLRLSPNTAIQFYDVQDRLGYDRPSKAIDWLMKEAKAAIEAIGNDPTRVNGFNHGYLNSNQTGQMGFFNMGNGGILPSSNVFQNDCPRNGHNNSISTSLETWQNGTFLFSSGANQRGSDDLHITSFPVKDPVQDLGQNQFEFTQPREPFQSSLFNPISASTSSLQFSSLNVNYSNNGFSNEFLSSLQEQSSISGGSPSDNSHIQE
ncbi:hypothetical protein Leryth_022347 [Lithospermum erythrorhizon]|nr:hypothetical protein Leryth_022347 [Lithospermum erythrorhizon]